MLRRLAYLLLGLFALGSVAAALAPMLLIHPAPLRPESGATVAPHAGQRMVTLPTGGSSPLALHIRDSGGERPQRRTFVLVHGFTFNLYTWDGIDGALRGHGRVLAYDQIPYGRSDKPTPSGWRTSDVYTRKAALGRLFALLDHFALQRVVLVGNSSGAALALEAARAQPQRIEGLVLLAPWVFSRRPSLPDWLIDLPQMQRLLLWLARALGTDMPLLDRSYHEPQRIDDQRRRLAAVHRQTAGWDIAWARLLARSLSDAVEIDRHLDDINTPTLVIAGTEDRIVPVDDSRTASRRLPMAAFSVIDGCGHVPQEECPDAVARAIERWLTTLP